MDDRIDQDWNAVTQADVDAAELGDLIPTGTYEGLVQSYTKRVVDKEESPFFGLPIARLTIDLFDVPIDNSPQTRKYFADVTSVQVKQKDGRMSEPSRLGAQLAKHTNTVGKIFSETLETALLTRLRFRVRLSPARDPYEARNWTDAITAL